MIHSIRRRGVHAACATARLSAAGYALRTAELRPLSRTRHCPSRGESAARPSGARPRRSCAYQRAWPVGFIGSPAGDTCFPSVPTKSVWPPLKAGVGATGPCAARIDVGDVRVGCALVDAYPLTDPFGAPVLSAKTGNDNRLPSAAAAANIAVRIASLPCTATPVRVALRSSYWCRQHRRQSARSVCFC